jgi:uncharacterized protein (UPF0335 family)
MSETIYVEDINSIADIIIELYLKKGMTIKQIYNELKKLGYDGVTIDNIIDFIKKAKEKAVDYQGTSISLMFMDSLTELYKQVEQVKAVMEKLDLETENKRELKMNIDLFLKAQATLNKMVMDFAKLTGELKQGSGNTYITENKTMNVTQVNSAFYKMLIELVEAGKVKILDEELKATYERIKRRPEIAGL